MISVIVIGRNEGERLEACLTSAQRALRMLSYELIYVDSHSTDDSLAVARAHGARCFLPEATDTTAGLGRYIGTQAARGEYLLFLDGDMQLQPGFVERAMLRMAAGGCDGVCGIRTDHYMKNGQVVSVCENYFGCTRERVAPEFGGAIFLTAEALARCGGWATDTVACEEAELHARLLDAGCTVIELPVPMIIHCDAVRDARGPLDVAFSRRRLGEGQALRCAMQQKRAGAYIRHERGKLAMYALDWLCVALLLLAHPWGIPAACFVQALELGYLLAKRRPRAFVSVKLFFFAFPAGLVTYRRRGRGYTQVQ